MAALGRCSRRCRRSGRNHAPVDLVRARECSGLAYFMRCRSSLLERARPTLAPHLRQVARQDRSEGLPRLGAGLLFFARRIAAEPDAGEQVLGLRAATPMSSRVVVPSVIRFDLPPMSYCTTQRAAPPVRSRTPKPPRSSSKNVVDCAGRQRERLQGGASELHWRSSWAGPGQVAHVPASPCLDCIGGI